MVLVLSAVEGEYSVDLKGADTLGCKLAFYAIGMKDDLDGARLSDTAPCIFLSHPRYRSGRWRHRVDTPR